MQKRRQNKELVIGYLLVAISAVCFGIMPIFARIAYASGADTLTLLFFRFFAGGVLLSLVAWKRKALLPPKGYWPIVVLLGVLGYTGTSFCYFTALKYASASVVSLLLYAYPALVTLFSVLFTHEKLSFATGLSLALALLGCILVIGLGGHAEPKGVILALIAAFAYSLYILISAQVVGKRTAMASSAVIIVSSSLSYLFLMLRSGVHLPQTVSGVLATLSLALFSTVVAFWSFFAGMGRIGATNASLVSTLEPLVTVFSAVLFLGELPSFATLGGGALIIIALVLSVTTQTSPTGTSPAANRSDSSQAHS
ncbi:MAG: DMT family transporter [Sphaerochaeta sp.]|uniref:DMT family transporter n=1 Tax=Sphaerochaeta sp. TaxID=1972642 RepID=UPI00357712AA